MGYSANHASELRGRTVAWFDSLEAVRTAETTLERNGIDSRHIHVGDVENEGQRREIDQRSMAWATKKGAVGLVVGAALGALLGWLIGSIVMEAAADVAAFALGGAIFGLAPGFLYAVFTSVPTDAATFDTFADDDAGQASLAIDGPREVREKAAELLGKVDPAPRRLVTS